MEINKDELKKELSEAFKSEASPFIKDQIKEQLDAAIVGLKASFVPDPEIEKAEKEGKGKFKSLGEQLVSIFKLRSRGEMDNRLIYFDSAGKRWDVEAAKKTMTEGTDSAGGFLVFEEQLSDIRMIALENSIILNNGVTTIPMATDTLNLPRVVDTAHTSTVYGGIVMYDEAEGDTLQESNVTWGSCKLTAHKMGGYTKASNELLADNGVGLEAWLKPRIGEAMGWFKDLRFIRGTGVGQPLGLLNAGALISVTRTNTAQVFYRDLINIYGQMLPSSRDAAIWIMNHEVYQDLLRMVDLNAAGAEGTAGTHQVFLKNIIDIPAKTILGRPFFLTEKMSALGNAGDIGFFDLSYYIYAPRTPLTIDASTHVYFTTDHTAWRFTERFDGQPWLASAITPYLGSKTLSPFVQLTAAS